MQIEDVKLHILEDPNAKVSEHRLIQVPTVRRLQFTHTQDEGARAERLHVVEVQTDEGLVSRCTTTMTPEEAAVLRKQVLGRDPFAREYLFQLLAKGTRWVYQRPGWFGDFDNCLWDIAGQAAGLPAWALFGRVRDKLPVYLTGGNMDIPGYLEHIEQGHRFGVNAYKFHSYKGGAADKPIYRKVRAEVGDDYQLITDPVCSYDLREAIEIGHLLEELDFIWLEEPMHEQKLNLYQKLCAELTIPVMGTETIMNDMDLTAQWLIQGGTDLLRGNARAGATQVLKLAHFAELHGANIELNSGGGLFGLYHAHMGCCIKNTTYYEYFGRNGDELRRSGERWGMVNAPFITDGHIAPPDGPGWGAEWDEARFRSLIVQTV